MQKYDKIIQAKLISYTQPVFDIPISNKNKSLSALIGFCARVSNPINQNKTETIDKLIEYLIKNKHWSPFEMANVCIEIVTTRDIARQILRHRSFSFQEFSQRYSNPTQFLDFTLREFRLQDTKDRQNSIKIEESDSKFANKIKEWYNIQKEIIKLSKEAYQWAIKNGVAKEVARAVLPEGLTLSKLYMNGTLRSWIHYIELRKSNGTQLEHKQIAVICSEIINNLFNIAKTNKHAN